jgi:hypothetical protein
MKHLNKILVTVMMVMGLNSQAQDSQPLGNLFENAVDTRTSAENGTGFSNGIFSTICC